MENRVNWRRLDNAAKIFPSASDKYNTQVFRFACELNEEVECLVLQEALEDTLERFPIYRSVLKHGFFWHYLEESEIVPVVRKEYKPPCSTIYHTSAHSLLFEVTYYKRRINLEVFHVLSDGTGAMQFLRTLVYHYLLHKHADELETLPELDIDASDEQKMDDSFSHYYTAKNKRIAKERKLACQVKGQHTPERRLKVIEGVMPVQEVLQQAHAYHTTMTGFLAAVLLEAIGSYMPERMKRREAVLEIPVNLRKYFQSESIRNFFGIVHIPCDLRQSDGCLETLASHVDARLKQELEKDAVAARLNALSAMEHNAFARVVPLTVKDFCLRTAYRFSRYAHTAVLSNVGRVDMPKPLRKYIRLFDVIASTSQIQICACSFQDNLTVTFTSQFAGSDIERRFFRRLAQMGIPVTISANQLRGEE